jgi:tRNA-2-methylthio-N6-dimethylallyladenosine synthase
MHRAYTTAQYRTTIDAIRTAMPHASVTTDVIVGFPGETDEAFEGTVRLVNEVRFDAVNTAVYSPRDGTPAAGYPDQVPGEIKRRRLSALNQLVTRIASEVNQPLVGTCQEVLVENPGTRGGVVGRTRTNKVVTVAADPDLIGHVVPVEITAAGSWVLHGRIAAALTV